jgi:hypothetical protein
MPRKHHRELMELLKETRRIQGRVDELKKEGANVDQITAALAQLGTDLDSLIAKPGGITPAQTQTILDGITALDAKVKAALTPAV